MGDILTLKIVLVVFAFIIMMDVVDKSPEEIAMQPVKIVSPAPVVSTQDSIEAALKDSTAAEINIPK